MIKRKEKYFYGTKKKIITKKNMSFDVSDIVSVIINIHYFDQFVILDLNVIFMKIEIFI
jgi:hypothetical protein